MAMTKSPGRSADGRLWNADVTPDNYCDQKAFCEHALEQYKLYVDSALKVSEQRGNANTFFLTLHTLLVGAIGLIFQARFQPDPRWLILVPVAAALTLCWVWYRLLISYQQLNSAKFVVIREFENRLPAQPFVSAEWYVLGEGNDPELYRPFTTVEKWVPFIFAFLYILSALAFIFSFVVPGVQGAGS